MAVSAVVSLTSLALWIALGAYVSNNGMLSIVTNVHSLCVVAISVHCARHFLCLHRCPYKANWFCCCQSLWREGSMRTLGSGVRTAPCVRPLLPTVSRMDWSWLA